MSEIEQWNVLLDTENGGVFYETPEKKVAYEKRNGDIVGPTENDAVRSAFEVLRRSLHSDAPSEGES